MYVNVSGGTRAGWRKVMHAVRHDWRCPSCKARNRYYWRTCAACNHPRPD